MSLASIKKPGRKDFSFVRGDSFQRTLTVKQGGSPFNFTGWEVEAFVMAEFPIDPKADPIETFAATVVAPEIDGRLRVQLTDDETEGLPAKNGWYLRVKLTSDPDNNTHTLLWGELNECDHG